jgi:uncharacterized protein YciI
MKPMQTFLPGALCLGLVLYFGCNAPARPEPDPIFNPDLYTYLTDQKASYDSVFAKRTGADGYGMKKYVMAMLKAGPNRNQDSATVAGLQKAHLQNIRRMAQEGKLVLAGPFMDEGTVVGIYIFNVESLEEARALTSTDPAIKAGRLEMELRPWYGPASLQMVVPLHKRLEKKSVAD